LELETEELGYVKTSVEKQGDRIIVKFELENLQRLDSLKENLNNLEQQLKGHGFEEVVMEFNFHKESHQQDSQKAFHHAGNKVFKIDDSNNLPQMEEVSVTRDYGYNSMEYTI
ncbi:MAG TPA: flagellar hook-length control protein FliK, partial [Candidatus Cloacimonadota bacterium]|nr:flagellar hook-length control protein FliK [Candidatus Cloacimonadota bacterium]